MQPVSIVYEATDHSHTLRKVLNELGEARGGKLHREKIRESMRNGH